MVGLCLIAWTTIFFHHFECRVKGWQISDQICPVCCEFDVPEKYLFCWIDDQTVAVMAISGPFVFHIIAIMLVPSPSMDAGHSVVSLNEVE